MSTRHRIVTALVRMYPADWRREYGPELTDVLLAGRLGPRAIANVIGSACRERLRSADMRHLLLRALVAYGAMEILTMLGFATQRLYGREHAVREFTLLDGMLIGAIVTTPIYLGALLGAIVPAAVMLGPLRRTLGRTAVVLAGAGVGVPAFASVILVFWFIDGAHYRTFTEFLVAVLRGRGIPVVFAALVAGGAIVMSGRPRKLESATPRDAAVV